MAFRSMAALAGGLLVTACSSLVPATLARMQAMDPLTADPSAIEVALVLPPGLAVAPGSAVLNLGAVSGDARVEERFALKVTPAAISGIDVPPGATASLFRLTPADARRMREVQGQIASWKAEDPRGTTGSLSIGLGGCGIGAGPADDARASVLIRPEVDSPFLPLFRDVPVRQLIGPALFDAITPCESRQ